MTTQEKLDLKWGEGKVTFVEWIPEAKNKIAFTCNKCGTRSEVFIGNLNSRKTWCKKCFSYSAKTHEQFIEEVKKISPDIEILDKYKRDNIPVRAKHSICGTEWLVTPSNLIQGRGCPNLDCINDKRKRNLLEKTNGQYTHTSQQPKTIDKHRILYKRSPLSDLYIEATKSKENFIHFLEEIPFEHRTYRYIATLLNCAESTVRSSLATRFDVKELFNRASKSHWQDEVNLFITSLGVKTENNKRKMLDGLEIDIFIPELNIGFECNGIATHCSDYQMGDFYKTKAKDYHKKKTDLAQEKGIHLIHIFEDEWKKSPLAVQDRIRSLLKKQPITIDADKCTAIFINNNNKVESFLKENNIQGLETLGELSLGLLNSDNELVALVSFKKNLDNTAELLKYCTKLETEVTNGFSKLLDTAQVFLVEEGFKKILSTIDLTWESSKDNIYSSLDWKQEKETPPDYFYCKKNYPFDRSYFKKEDILKQYPNMFSPEETETEMVQEIGQWARIYDCGKILYSKELKEKQ